MAVLIIRKVPLFFRFRSVNSNVFPLLAPNRDFKQIFVEWSRLRYNEEISLNNHPLNLPVYGSIVAGMDANDEFRQFSIETNKKLPNFVTFLSLSLSLSRPQTYFPLPKRFFFFLLKHKHNANMILPNKK